MSRSASDLLAKFAAKKAPSSNKADSSISAGTNKTAVVPEPLERFSERLHELQWIRNKQKPFHGLDSKHLVVIFPVFDYVLPNEGIINTSLC